MITQSRMLSSCGSCFAKKLNTLVSDIEFGAGMMLKGCTAFPSMMSYAVAGDPELASRIFA